MGCFCSEHLFLGDRYPRRIRKIHPSYYDQQCDAVCEYSAGDSVSAEYSVFAHEIAGEHTIYRTAVFQRGRIAATHESGEQGTRYKGQGTRDKG